MKVFKFEVTIKEEDLEGDEFWEEALAKDGTGISDLTEVLKEGIYDRLFAPGTEVDLNELVKLKEYKL